MHPIRVNALELLLRYVQVLSDSHTEGNHLDLMKASVLANLEPLILSESGSMASKGEPYLKSLNVSFWESGPLECLVSEKPLTLDNHLEMLGVLLDYPLKMSADAGRSPQGRNLSVGSAQDANLDFMFWSNTIMASIFPAFFPFVCEQVGFESPVMSKGLRTCPLQIQLVLAKVRAAPSSSPPLHISPPPPPSPLTVLLARPSGSPTWSSRAAAPWTCSGCRASQAW